MLKQRLSAHVQIDLLIFEQDRSEDSRVLLRTGSLLTNDGRGDFELSHYIPARSDGACALLVDVDNDRDLDLALVDEVADEILIYKNDPLGEVRKQSGNGVGRNSKSGFTVCVKCM